MATCALLSTWYYRNSERVARRMVGMTARTSRRRRTRRLAHPARSHVWATKNPPLPGRVREPTGVGGVERHHRSYHGDSIGLGGERCQANLKPNRRLADSNPSALNRVYSFFDARGSKLSIPRNKDALAFPTPTTLSCHAKPSGFP